MVMPLKGKEGKYWLKSSSSFNFPLSLNCRMAVEVKIFEIDARLKRDNE